MVEIKATQETILTLLAKSVPNRGPFTADTDIIVDTGLDSVSVMDLVLELEDEFDVTIPLDRIAEIRTVSQLAQVLHELSNRGA